MHTINNNIIEKYQTASTNNFEKTQHDKERYLFIVGPWIFKNPCRFIAKPIKGCLDKINSSKEMLNFFDTKENLVIKLSN